MSCRSALHMHLCLAVRKCHPPASLSSIRAAQPIAAHLDLALVGKLTHGACLMVPELVLDRALTLML